MPGLPTGTVTFLFTDIEGSTRLWEEHPRAMQDALARHDSILRRAIEDNEGHVFKTVGDAFCAAFPTALDALNAALCAHRALQSEEWGEGLETNAIRIRVAIHTGVAQERDGDYFGPALNRVARLQSAGYGQQTLLSMPTYELVRDHLPAGVTLLDLSERRLKDLLRPEHVFQVVTSDIPSQFPPLKTLESYPNNLQLQPTPLVGREAEVAAICAILRDPDARLVTLTGPGGTGKTRLALQAGAELLEDFSDGVWFVELAALVDAGLVLSTIAQVAGVQEGAGQPLIEALKGSLKDKQMLLILDNFEQVLTAAPQVTQLLAACRGVKVLVTSRIPLRVRGEKEYPVPPLSLPDYRQMPPIERLPQYDSVRLFIERATDIKPDFEVTNENAPAVAEICVRLDGLPLAIELAAARVRLFPPQALLGRLSSRLKVLTGGARDLPARQQTLRSAIEWSYDLLDEREKQFFRRMAVFQGGRTLDAMEAVCNFDGQLAMDVLDGAESLVSKNLLQQREGRDGEPRFWMLETIHEYAREKLEESGGEKQLQSEHAQFFVNLAREARSKLTGPEQIIWTNRLDEEQDNFRSAFRWLLEEDDASTALRLCAALQFFWYIKGYFTEGRDWLVSVLARADPSMRTQEHAIALYAAARFAYYQGDYEPARLFAEESIAIGRELADSSLDAGADVEEGLPHSLIMLAAVSQTEGNYTLSKSLLEEALVLAKKQGNKEGIAWALLGLGELKRLLGDYSAARSFYEESLVLYKELDNRAQMGVDLGNLGTVELLEGNHTAADALFREGLKISLAQGADSYNTPFYLLGFAEVAVLAAKPGRAAYLFGAADALLKRMGLTLEIADRGHYDHFLAQARDQLDEATWQKAWEEGRATSVSEAIAYATDDIDVHPPARGDRL